MPLGVHRAYELLTNLFDPLPVCGSMLSWQRFAPLKKQKNYSSFMFVHNCFDFMLASGYFLTYHSLTRLHDR